MSGLIRELREAERTRAAWVAGLLVVCVLAGFVAVLVRVVQLQVAPSEDLRRFADDRTARFNALARRGDIHDRRGRIVAATRTGQRLFVDPARIEEDAGGGYNDLLLAIADATGEDVSVVADRVLTRVQRNADRAFVDGDDAVLYRYVSIGGVLPDGMLARAERLAERRAGVHLEEVTAREAPAGNLLAAVVGKVGAEGDGLAGVEARLNNDLHATPGFVEPVLDARGRSLWVPPDGYAPSVPGAPVRLSIDLELQRIVVEELERRVEELDAAGARCVMVDPETGELLAIADVLREVDAIEAGSPEHKAALAEDRRVRVRTMREDPMRETEPALARVRSVVDIYEPGSTFKPFVWASLVERGAVRVDEAFDTEGGVWVTEYGRRLEDEAPRDEQTWADVLVHSSNIGMAKGAARVSFGDLRDDVLRWGFGRSTGVGIPGEARGLVTRARDWTDLSQSSVPMGYEVGVTPLQMARAFSVFARSGNRAGEMPGLSLEALRTGDPRLRVTERLLRPSVAEAGRDAMVEVAEKMATRTPLWIPGEERFAYTAFGKSGTAKMVSPAGGYLERQYTSSFVAGVPAERPRIVLVVIIDDPGPEVVRKGRYFGSMTAGPALLRIASRAMGYLGVTPDRVDEDEVAER